MKVIYKYPFKDNLKLPKGYIIRHIGAQNDKLFVWAEVDPAEKLQVQTGLSLVPTGIEMGDDFHAVKFLQTVMQHPFVWHIYQCSPQGSISETRQEMQL